MKKQEMPIAVLDGKIDIFINAYLKYVAQKGVK